MNTLRVMSALLTYPTAELKSAIPELIAVLNEERILSSQSRRALVPLFNELKTSELLDLEEVYVLLFDRTRSFSLHLFQHVHGESRDRGQAMVDLHHQYQQAGLSINSNELPDYIPMFLEYLSLLKPQDARTQLGMCSHILTVLAERLRKQKSSYSAVFLALLEIADNRPTTEELSDLLSQEIDDPDNMPAVDQIWEEQAVSFGPDAQNCEGNMSSTYQTVQFNNPPHSLNRKV